MNDELPYNPPGMAEYIRAGAAHNQRLLAKWKKEEADKQDHLARVRELQRRLDAAQTQEVEDNILRLMELENEKWNKLAANANSPLQTKE